MFKALRIFMLLLILAGVALGSWRTRIQSVEWKYRLPVNIYFINGDDSPVAADFLRSLTVEDFEPIETFMRDEAARYGQTTNAPIEIRLGGKIESRPPVPPRNESGLEVIVWSLKMRWWAYWNTDTVGPGPQVKIFVLYFDPAQNKRLGHSTGLQKGLIGRVNTFAASSMTKQNNVIIAHEFLHTLGATDKYDPNTNLPLFPDGYANPSLKPLLPQRFAEIMAGRTPLSTTEAETPATLEDALIGNKTAQEINWL
jgi:hypothetical protein